MCDGHDSYGEPAAWSDYEIQVRRIRLAAGSPSSARRLELLDLIGDLADAIWLSGGSDGSMAAMRRLLEEIDAAVIIVDVED